MIREFFAFWPDVSPASAFGQFDRTHLTALLIVGLLLFVCIRGVIRLPQPVIGRILKITAVLLPFIELARVVWLISTGETEWSKLLPLHLCGTQVVFIPLAVFTSSRTVKEFVYTTSLLGGIVAILFPAGVAGTYPFFHFQTLQTIALHSILIFVPLVMVLGQGFRPQLSRFCRVLGLLVFVALVAGTVDVLFGENYMFLLEPPPGTPLIPLFHRCGRAVYLLVLFCLVSLGMLLTVLPFRKKERTLVGQSS